MSIETADAHAWTIAYDQYDPKDEGRREALFALGNGYVVSRAAAPESAEDNIHYPGTYRVGCYNRVTSPVEGKTVEHESLVNLPNWLSLRFRIGDGPWFSLQNVRILEYRQELNLQQALLQRRVCFQDRHGRESVLEERRFISMAQPHLLALEQRLTALNWSGTLKVESSLEGNVQNNNVARYAAFQKQHIDVLATKEVAPAVLELKARTRQSSIDIVLTAQTRIQSSANRPVVNSNTQVEKNRITSCFELAVQAGESVLLEKIAALYTSQDRAVADCSEAAQHLLKQAGDFDILFADHCRAWDKLWQACRLEVENREQLRYFRLHMFQILQNISLHTADLDVGVPPSGWQGEEYHGHIFWDELFIFPFLAFRFPTIARSLLLYRYRRLDKARELARQSGYCGAMFPWRSATTGREETPLLQLNLYSGHLMPDHTNLQRHIGAIIAYSVCSYVEMSGDHVFLAEYGAEMLLEIARFWASKAQFNAELDRYEIRKVVGPDEHHTRYPNSDRPGIDNNTFTNVMAVWTLRQALRLFEQLAAPRKTELSNTLSLRTEELEQWQTICSKMYLPLLPDGLLDQFEGFDQLQKFNLARFREKYGGKRIDWTLEAQGDAVNRYQVSKQADTSLLLYLFSPVQLLEMLADMGYALSERALKKTILHHIAHTANESSLSRIVHAGALAQFDPEASWKFFQEAQYIDLSPEEDQDTSEGIHLGAMGGTLWVLQHHYLGIDVAGGVLRIDPRLPPQLGRVMISLLFRGVRVSCEASSSRVRLRSLHNEADTVEVSYLSQTKQLSAGETLEFQIN